MNTIYPSYSRSPLAPITALAMAALGQLFFAQSQSPFSLFFGCFFYGLSLVIFWRVVPNHDIGGGKNNFPVKLEVSLLAAILILALFLRVYRLGEIPSGLSPEAGCEGWGALEILTKSWRPFFEIYRLRVWDPPVYYLLALWFKAFPAGQISLLLFFVSTAILSFFFIYWAFRQLAGPRVALAGLFILAVMRWHILFSRNGHPAIQVPLYAFGALSFYLYAFQKGKRWAFLAGSFFFTMGFYVYEAYKAFPILVLLYLFYEYRFSKTLFKKNLTGLLISLSLMLVGTFPWVLMIVLGRNMGLHEQHLLFLPGVFKDGLFIPLLQHCFDYLLMFNYRGDDWFLQNLPNHRMLDDVTGVFFVLGAVLAAKRIGRRDGFYPLTGFIVMGLPVLLTVNPTHAARAFGTVPFIALLAASAIGFFGKTLLASGWVGKARNLYWLLLPLFGLMLFQNVRVYFFDQARDYAGWRGNFVETTEAGKTIARYGGDYEYFIASKFYGNYTVSFLGYAQQDCIQEFKPTVPPLSLPAGVKGALFILSEGQTGVLGFLQYLYPGGETEFFKDPNGHALVYLYKVPASTVLQCRGLPPGFGLQGTYYQSLDQEVGPKTRQRDPLLNFTFHNDFPFVQFPPLTARWIGRLKISEPGTYRFLSLTTDTSAMDLDGKNMFQGGNEESAGIFLKAGLHSLDVLFQKTGGEEAAFNLLWKRPGHALFEVIPFEAFRKK